MSAIQVSLIRCLGHIATYPLSTFRPHPTEKTKTITPTFVLTVINTDFLDIHARSLGKMQQG